MKNKEIYERYWKATNSDDPWIAKKGEYFISLIPGHVKNILDVGCGDGVISRILSDKFQVISLDISSSGVKKSGGPGVVGDASSLPIKGGSMDVVLCSELLEHIENDETLHVVIRELFRVSGKYVLLSLPENEILRKRFVFCSKCRHEFHVYHHYRSFNEESITSLFSKYQILNRTLFGEKEHTSYAWLYSIQQKIGNKWWTTTNPVFCPCCKQNIVNIFPNILGLILWVVNRVVENLRKPSFYWQIILLEKQNV